jgi:outer membrane protein assembly factor BamB
MITAYALEGRNLKAVAVGLLFFCCAPVWAAEWPQYRGPAHDGSSPDALSANWPVSGPTVVWTNTTLTNGFSCLAVSQGRAFTLISKSNDVDLLEYCVGIDAATGTNHWATPIDSASQWNPSYDGDGGAGTAPYNTGDGPRTTPSVAGGRVIALSGLMHLVCLNVTNGAVIWSNNLPVEYGASTITWENAASPCLDNDLVFVNLNTSTNSQNLAAFRVTDGSLAWSGQDQKVTHTTPVVATFQGVRQVIFATTTGLVSLDRSTGALLWKFTYPFPSIGTSMGAGPVVYSNIVYCTADYGRGAFALQVTFSNSTWNLQQVFYRTEQAYQSIWMTPVCYQGYVYTLQGRNTTFLTPPLNCIELATGDMKWSTNNFGMGGLILVGNNLLVLTEKGELVVVQPSPDGYQELARYQAFEFNSSAPGKCWNNATFSDGRIYARSTRGAICLDVSVPEPIGLKLLPPQFLTPTQLSLTVAMSDGTPIASNRLPNIEVRATNALGSSPSAWPKLTNQLVLDTNGVARLTNTISPSETWQFYRTVESP